MVFKRLALQVKALLAFSFFINFFTSGLPLLAQSFDDACVAPIRIMPLGDSITRGSGTSPLNGYRKPLYLSLTDAGYAVDFVGSKADGGPSGSFDMNHEGHSGVRDDLVATRVYNWLLTNPADVVLLHIGTNDMNPGVLDTTPEDIENILNEIDRFNEDITVILARIINRQPYSPETHQFNIDVAAMAEARIAGGDKIIIVDQESALTYTEDMSDDKHPNSAGYEKMADVWLAALVELLPLCSSTPTITSDPVTEAFVGQPYTYDVAATGTPSPTYALAAAPEGMTIDAATGAIFWTPEATGAFAVTVAALNPAGSDTQSFTIVVVETPPPDSCGGLILEAEAGTLSGAFTVGIDSAASNGHYVHVPDGFGDQLQVDGNEHQANYCFTVTTQGIYRLKGWVYAQNTTSNAFFVQVDDGPPAGYLWNLPKNTVYLADYVNNSRLADPVEVALAAGEHTVTVYLRKDGARLDRLELEWVAPLD
jgi:lysophospholipase L1-like esterase